MAAGHMSGPMDSCRHCGHVRVAHKTDGCEHCTTPDSGDCKKFVETFRLQAGARVMVTRPGAFNGQTGKVFAVWWTAELVDIVYDKPGLSSPPVKWEDIEVID